MIVHASCRDHIRNPQRVFLVPNSYRGMAPGLPVELLDAFVVRV